MSDSRIKQIIDKSGLPPAALGDVQAAIDSSPYLAAVMLKAIDEQRIRRFSLSDDPNQGGHYDRATGTIGINPDYFRIRNREERLDGLTSVIGHEAGHALMARSAEITEYRYAFEVETAIRTASRNGEAGVDITPFARHALDDFRKNEGLAELVSMNSLASRVTKAKGAFDTGDFLARADAGTECIDNGKLDPGIRLNAKGYQFTGGEITSPAIERVAVCHFDDGAKTLGLKGTSSYEDMYAAYTLGAAVAIWKDYARGTTRAMPQIEVDLATLKSSRQGVEDAGIDLGGKGKTFDFVDLAGGQRRPIGIQQLGNGPEQPSAPIAQKTVLANDPSHPDFGTFNRIHEWVRGTGQWDEEKSRNVASALYREQASDSLFHRVDQVCGSRGKDGAENVFAVYAPFGEKGPFFHAHVDGRHACQQAAQQNLQQAEEIRLQQVLDQELQKNLRQNDSAVRGPSLSL